MKTFALRNAGNGSLLASTVARANNFIERGVGLLPRKAVAPNEGLWIGKCSAVHTVGMRAALDLFFLDREDRVLKIAIGIPPNQLAVSCRGAVSAVELGAAPDGARDVLVGDRLVLE